MENNNNAKSFFNKLGLQMVLSSLIVFGVQIGMLNLFGILLPEKMENYDFMMAVSMLPLFLIAYPITLRILRLSSEQKKYVNRRDRYEMTTGQIFVAFLMGYGLIFLGNLLGTGITNGIAAVRGEDVVNPLLEIINSGSLWATAIYTVLLAPVFEELIFRKMIVDKTVRYGEKVAIVLSGILFGLFHANFSQFFYALFLGMFLAFIYIRTNNVKYVIILHAMINFVGTFLGGLIIKWSTETGAALIVASILSYVILAIIVSGIVLLIVNRKKFALQPVEGELEKKDRFKTVYCNLGMMIYILGFIAFMVCQSMGLVEL